MVPQSQKNKAPNEAFGYPKMDEKDEPMMQRDPAQFIGYQDAPEEKKEAPGDIVDASKIDGFMAPQERERAQTFYLQLQREREDQLCKFCEKVILDIDMENNNMTMLQTTDCFHQVHIDCLREECKDKLSNCEEVKCPRCQVPIASAELN